MRLGLVVATKKGFGRERADPADLDSEVLADFEEDALLSGLRDAGHVVLRIGDDVALLNRIGHWRKECDLVFNAYCGYRGLERKVTVPAILEVASVPYLGSTAYVQGLTRNKYHAKLVVKAAGLDTPPAILVSDRSAPLDGIPYPVIVKPVGESSAIGIVSDSVAASPAQAAAQAARLLGLYGQPVLVETFVPGVEVEVPLFIDPAPRSLGVVAITHDAVPVEGDVFLTSDYVYSDDYGFAPPPPTVDLERLVLAAQRATAALGIRDYGRIDFRVDADGTPWFLEASTHPHLQTHSSFNWLADRRGLSYHEMLDELVQIAARREGLI